MSNKTVLCLHLKSRSLSLTVSLADDNYLPESIVVMAGEADDSKVLNMVNIDW